MAAHATDGGQVCIGVITRYVPTRTIHTSQRQLCEERMPITEAISIPSEPCVVADKNQQVEINMKIQLFI
jgi:hypothetical protein